MHVGLQQFLATWHSWVGKRRVGLVTHAAAVLPDLTRNVDALLAAGVRLTALFGPEHGLYGAEADGLAVNHTVDRRTGLPIYSLYGETPTPTPAMLTNVDVLLFDMQSVGVRFYTYLSTLVHVLRGAARAGVPVLILDRPNPLDGLTLEGPCLAPAFTSFIGELPIPIRHGMTLGELARYANATLTLGAELRVVTMSGWRRAWRFKATGLPWVPTSPAMAHLSAVALYPGTCLLEWTNVSEGRGTSLPFEICGAPWIDGYALAAHLNALDLPGVRFRPIRFIPTASKFAGQLCEGVQLHITDTSTLRPVTIGVHLLAALRHLHLPHFAWQAASTEGAKPHIDLLCGTDSVRYALEAGIPVAEIVTSWERDLQLFAEARHPYLLYPPAEAA